MLAGDLEAWQRVASGPPPRRYARPADVARLVDPRTMSSPALEKIDERLIALTDAHSEVNALAVAMPPQEGKSQRCSRTYPEWLLDHDPRLRIAILSYELDSSLRWGRDIKNDITQHPCRRYPKSPAKCTRACGGLHVQIRRDSMAAGRWETPQGGGVYCVGIGGPFTGRPVDVLVIDDPVKDRVAAESETVRKSTWDWWESVAIPRLGTPSTRVVLIQTRWHQDDLWGRIFSRPGPLEWEKLVIPAIAGDSDPLDREPGQELVSVRGRVPGHFRNLRDKMTPYVFSSIYQQTPTASEGNFFRRAAFRYWRWGEPMPDGRPMIECEGHRHALDDIYKFATVDVAGTTKTTNDFTVVSVWGLTMDRNLILLDRHRKRVLEQDHFSLVNPLRATWKFEQTLIEKSYYSKTLVADAIDNGMGFGDVYATTDKVTRAIPAADWIHSGRVWFPAETSGCPCGNCPDVTQPDGTVVKGVWLQEWLDELTAFNHGSHDDQVDTLSYAVIHAVHGVAHAADAPPRGQREPWEQAIANAATAATGYDGDLDIMNQGF
jgi:phage terminase large subunit-like protein